MNPLSKYYFLTSGEREALLLDIASQRLAQIPGALQRFRSDTLFKLHMNVNSTLNDWFNTEDGFRIRALRLVDKWAADNCNPLAVRPVAITSVDAAPPTYRPHVGWQIALLASWADICKTHGRQPTAAEAVQWLRKNDTSGTIENKGANTEMWWRTARGKVRQVSLKTVGNVISKWRVEGVIPA